MIPEEALEAAAKAYYPDFWKPSEPIENYDKEPEFIKEKVRNFVRPILEATIPYLVPQPDAGSAISTDEEDIVLTDSKISEESSTLLRAELSPKEKIRVTAALGNMRTHLYLDRNKPVWVSVDKSDLEIILKYVKTLEDKLDD